MRSTKVIDHPVFYDRGGRRWKRTVTVGAGLFAILVIGLAWAVVKVFAPIWQVRDSYRPANYPEQVQASGAFKHLPVIGAEGVDTLARVDLVKHTDGKTYLTDPFSNKSFREATPEEVQTIGNHKYALEWYGHLPDHQIALTFDDGPDPQNTPEILNILSKYHVQATFFVVGTNVMKYPALLQREIREGHVIGNHTLSHIGFGHGSVRDRLELVGNDHLIRAVGHYQTRLFRIPYSNPDGNALAVFRAQRLGYVTVDMDLDTEDWKYKPGQTVPLPKLDGKGHVVLMHDGGANRAATIKLLPKFIREARAAGYAFTTPVWMLPPEYRPVSGISPSLSDRAAWLMMWTYEILPGRLVGWLFWFGVVSLTSVSLLYTVLAFINYKRQRLRTWPSVNSSAPLVSVVLPAFNEAKVIAKTLTSLRRSDYPNIEVVVIDDGSTDGTYEVLADIAATWPDLQICRQRNSGKAAALSHGIRRARGDIIVTLDADTVFEPQTIRVLVRHFEDPQVAVVAGHIKVGNRRNILTAWQSLEYISGICVTRMAEGLVGAISIAPGACSAWRKSAVLRAGGFSHSTLAEDCDLTLTLQRLGYKVVQENDAIAWTEAPITLRALAGQRLRWTFGNMQAFWKHRNILFRPRYGMLGMLVLPYAFLSIIVPLLFMPLTYVVAVNCLMQGVWVPVALFAAFVASLHFVISAAAIAMTRERPWHLLVVPIYRLIYEPLRTYLLYAATLKAVRGRAATWYRPERTETVKLTYAHSHAGGDRHDVMGLFRRLGGSAGRPRLRRFLDVARGGGSRG